ncbi:BA14K family protein [Mesorhizobium sp. M1027]
MQYCFSRYRSYRPEDNSYQPHSGGPRRQCE